MAELARTEGWEAPTWFDAPEDLIAAVDAIAIVTPTSEHARLATLAIDAGKVLHREARHDHPRRGRSLARAASRERRRGPNRTCGTVQPGLPSRPTSPGPAPSSSKPIASLFNPRGLDVPVVLDLMIHDIDLALHALEGEVVRVARTALPWSATAWTSRMPASSFLPVPWPTSRPAGQPLPMRKVRLFQPDAYLSVDLLNRSARSSASKRWMPMPTGPYGLYLDVPGQAARQLHIDTPDIGKANAIADDYPTSMPPVRAWPQVPLRDGLAACAWPSRSWIASPPHIMTRNWFTCVVKYVRHGADGSEEKTTDQLLLDAYTYTEAEARLVGIVTDVCTGPFEVQSITKSNYAEVVDSTPETSGSASRWR